ncbi:MAG: 50S ribosomal protein L25 [Salinivirgaceae bacterium]
MNVFEVKVKVREVTGKKDAKKLRKQEMVPCVIYGAKDVKHFYAHKNDFKDLVYTQNVYKVALDIDGAKHMAIMKDLQFHPVTDELIHIDFMEIEDGKLIAINVPVRLNGTAPGLMKGGRLRARRRYLKVSGMVADIPDFIDIDISKLEIGDGVKVGDLKRDKLTFVDKEDQQIVAVISGRAVAAAADAILDAAEAGDEEADAEGEGEEAAAEE